MQKHCRIFLLFSLLLSLIFTASCKRIEETESKVFPDILLRDATYLLGRSDEEDILFKAEEIDIYIDEEKAELISSEFEQKKGDGDELLISGRADKANINTKTYESSLSGNVHLLLHEDNNSIEADEIVWDKDNGEIISNGTLTLKYGDVTVSGTDFKGNIKTGIFTFRAIISGIIKGEEEIIIEESTPYDEQQGETSSKETLEDQSGENITTETSNTSEIKEQETENTRKEENKDIEQTTSQETPTEIIEKEIYEEISEETDENVYTSEIREPQTQIEDIETSNEEEQSNNAQIDTATPNESISESKEKQTTIETTQPPEDEIINEETTSETAITESETLPSYEENVRETPNVEDSVSGTLNAEESEQNEEIQEEREETKAEIETFEPIVDIIIVTRDGKVVK